MVAVDIQSLDKVTVHVGVSFCRNISSRGKMVGIITHGSQC